MNDEQLERAIGSFYAETEETPPDPRQSADRILAEVSHTRQVRRRWWLPALRPAAEADPAWHSPASHATPMPATNGRSHHAQPPTVPGRTTSMLGPVKAMTAGALVFALAGAFLITRPFDQLGTPNPAAEGDAVSMEPAWVTGTLLHAPTCAPPERTSDEDIVRERGYRCASQLWETSDARLSGRATVTWNADVHRLGPDVSVARGAYEIVTDTGAWECAYGPVVYEGSGLGPSKEQVALACTGLDAYDGLTAVLDVDVDAGAIAGLVFAGELPPPPEAAGQ